MRHYNKEVYDKIFGSSDRANTTVQRYLDGCINRRIGRPPYQPFPGKNPTRIYLNWGLRDVDNMTGPARIIKPIGSYFGKIGFFVPRETRTNDSIWDIGKLLIIDRGGLIGYNYFGLNQRTAICGQYFPNWGLDIADCSAFSPGQRNVHRKRLFKINGIYRYLKPMGLTSERTSLRNLVSSITFRDIDTFGLRNRVVSEERVTAESVRLHTELGYDT